MTHDVGRDMERDELRNEVLLAYIEACQEGHAPDREQFLAANADLRDELEEFFAAHEQVEQLAAGLRQFQGAAMPSDLAGTNGLTDLVQLGDFRLVREIARGGMGVVYEAEQISLKRRVALKLLPFASAFDSRQLHRFKNEAMAAAHVRHEHIVPVYAVGEDRGVHYYVMQYIEGRSLAAVIAERRANSTALSAVEAAQTSLTNTAAGSTTATGSVTQPPSGRACYEWVARIGQQAATALDYAHSLGIIHRDIKPANLLLDPDDQIWIADFGLAQMAGDTGLTSTGEVVGTIRYASPEQLLARRGIVDHRTDVYSLGATLYELLTLTPVFDGADRNELLTRIAKNDPRAPRLLDPFIPRELETIVLKALSKDPAQRYATAREFAKDLGRFEHNNPIQARRPGLSDRMIRLAARHPTIVAASVVMLLLLTAGSLLSAFLIRDEQQRTKVEQRKVQDAYERERRRAEEAEARFRLARRSVDEMFRISQEELADRPGTESLRKRLLWSVLEYYREFIEDRRDNPQAQAELVEASQQVENILSELSILRAATQIYLLNQEPVLADLNLTEVQRPRIKDFCLRVGKEWLESLSELGQLSPRERTRKSIERATRYKKELDQLLSVEQKKRLQQIGLQTEGAGAFGQPEVIAELQLSEPQREKIRMIEAESFAGWLLDSPLSERNDAPAVNDHSPLERVLKHLTPEQVEHWRRMTGAPITASVLMFPASVKQPGTQRLQVTTP